MARKKQKNKFKRIIKLGFAYSTLLILVVLIAGGIVWFRALSFARAEMPSIEAKLDNLKIPPSEILSADGKVLYEESDKFQEPVPLSQVPDFVQDAVISAEDRNFYQHSGVDIWAMVRALFVNVRDRRYAQGGSTLAMQLAKKLSSNGQKTLSRKLNDMALAYEMENEWSKKHVLQLYLNEAYFGEGAYGIKAAAATYFGKPLNKLTVAEAALLARCVRRPSDENPFANLNKAISNRNVVLGIMKNDNLITAEQYDTAIHSKVHLDHHHSVGSARILDAPFYVSQVLASLRKNHPDIDLKDGGYQIYTTLNSQVQQSTEDAVDNVLNNYSDSNVNQAALVLLNRQGGIIAEVGGANYKKDQFDIVTMGRMQPGSSFKPIVYATAIADNVLSADSYVSNERFVYIDPKTHKRWSPRNDDGRYGGQVSVREALAQSINVCAVRTLTQVGISKVIDEAHNVFGFTSTLPPFPSLALGSCSVSPIEMAKAYSVFFLNGNRFDPYRIDHIVDQDGLVVYSHTSGITQDVLDSRVCSQMDSLLQSVVQEGTGTEAQKVTGARGKTGTTNDHKDAWFCGYNRNFLAIAWGGNETYSKRLKRYVRLPMARDVWGGTVAIKIWVDAMLAAQKSIPAAPTAPDTSSAVSTNPAPPTTNVKVDENPNSSSSKVPDTSQGKQPASGVQTGSTSSGNPSVTQGAASGTSTAGNGQSGPQPSTSGTPGLGPAQGNDGSTAQIPNANNSTKTTSSNSESVKEPKRQVQYVWVWVCADSGELATPYCPETVRRRYVKGTQPKKYCTLHHP